MTEDQSLFQVHLIVQPTGHMESSKVGSYATLRLAAAASLALPNGSMSALSLRGDAAEVQFVVEPVSRVNSCLALP
jgi:hypothetical protein